MAKKVEAQTGRPPYEPIPVDVAGCVGKKFAKSQVVIIAWDPVHQLVHSTTWGRDPADKIQAARAGEMLVNALGCSLEHRETFQDFRLDAYRDLIKRMLDADVQPRHAYRGLTEGEYKAYVEGGLDGLLNAVLLAAKKV